MGEEPVRRREADQWRWEVDKRGWGGECDQTRTYTCVKLSKNKLEEEEGEGERKGGGRGGEKTTSQNQIKTETNNYLGPREMDNRKPLTEKHVQHTSL